MTPLLLCALFILILIKLCKGEREHTNANEGCKKTLLTETMSLAGLVASSLFLTSSTISALTTCPGFPGYCSEAFPGSVRMPFATYINYHDIYANMIDEIINFFLPQFCNVVCSRGRNNVPLCQVRIGYLLTFVVWIFSLATCK